MADPFALPSSRQGQSVGTALRSLHGLGQFLPLGFVPWRSFPWQAAKLQRFVSLPCLQHPARRCWCLSLHPSPFSVWCPSSQWS